MMQNDCHKKNTLPSLKLCGVLAGLLLCGACIGLNDADRDWEAKRQEALDRKRVVIYNTDGCDAVYYPLASPVTPEDPLSGSSLDAKGK